jgi:hypothetical protein
MLKVPLTRALEVRADVFRKHVISSPMSYDLVIVNDKGI